MQRVLAGAIATFLVLGAASVRAERVGLVVRVPEAAPAVTADVLSALGRAGAGAGDEVVRAPFVEARAALQDGAVEADRLHGFRRTSQLLAEGVRAYQSGDLEFAVARLSEARRLCMDVAALRGGRELVAEISLRLGAARLDLGQDRGALDLALASRLAPQREVTLAEFKPGIVEAYERVRGAEARQVNLSLESPVAGARAAVDSAEGVQIPWVGAVDSGLHLVVASAPGSQPIAVLVDAEGPRTVSLVLESDAKLGAVEAGGEAMAIGVSEKDAAVAVEALITYAELDAVVIATSVWRRGSPALVAERCVAGGGCAPSVEIRYDGSGGLGAAATELWRRLSASSGTLRPGLLTDARLVSPEGPGGPALPPARSWVENPYVWLGAATGVAAIAVTVLLVRGGDRQPVIRVGDDLFPER